MASNNMGKVKPLLRNVSGRVITDHVEFTFVNQTVRSRDTRFEVKLPPLIRDIPDLPLAAQPDGFYEVFVSPERYRHKSAFVSVTSGRGPVELQLDMFIQPEEARHRFHSFDTLKADSQWRELFDALDAGNVDEDAYDAYTPLLKGCLFNLHSKMQDQKVSNGKTVFSFVQSIIDVKQDRIFCTVKPELLDRTREHEEGFGAASGALHKFQGHDAVASFKTHEKVGNLQLTFFKLKEGQFVIDADLDDNQGIRHAFDVIQHKLTGDKTHPFDIHQILKHFHHIDPGYHLF